MKRTVVLVACFAAQVAGAQVHSVTSPPIWSPTPVGPQVLPGAPPINLLESIGDSPLQFSTTSDSCLLVTRRGQAIVAVELTPVVDGPKIVGWKPKPIDHDTLVSKWKYHESEFSGPVTDSIIAGSSTVSNIAKTSSAVKTWSNASKDSKGHEVSKSETAQSVTINGKTYSKFTNFKFAQAEVPNPSSDEYFCKN